MARSRRFEGEKLDDRVDKSAHRRSRRYVDVGLQELMEEIDAMDCGLELCDLPDEILEQFEDFGADRRDW